MKRYRKKKSTGCPNPLFEKWLEEWKQEAAAKKLNTQYGFKNALESLRKFPLPLATGKDCLLLQHFGSKLCYMLDKKLEQHNKLQNQPSTSATTSLPFNEFVPSKKLKKTESTSRQEENIEQVTAQVKEADKHGQTNRNRKTANKPYIPKIGSGAYALLTTLYKRTISPNYLGLMLKKDLISEAQEDCETPMKGSYLEHYSGWSSMSTLIEKHLVIKKSSPAKYSLTDAGFALACALLEGRENLHNSSDEDSASLCSNPSTKKSYDAINIPPPESKSSRSNFPSKSSGSKSSEVNSPSTENCKVSCAKESKEPPTAKKFKNGFNSSAESYNYQKNLPSYLDLTEDDFLTTESVPKVTNENEPVIIDLDDDDDDVFNYDAKIEPDNVKIDDFDKMQRAKLNSTDEEFEKFCEENVEPVITVKKKRHFIFAEPLDNPGISSEINENNFKTVPDTIHDEIQPECSIPKKRNAEVTNGNGKVTEGTDVLSHKEKRNIADSFILLPNNFKIILLVDTQETNGTKAKPKDDATVSELTKSGVLFEVRSLKIGDFTWIARCAFTNKELVLPYIIERKRMDDLCASIVDGRYHEQKFRLRQSGIKNVVYMVENYSKNYHGSIPLASLLQAAVNSLVQDNFNVKHTKDHRDSMRYLATMTTMLTKIYESRELSSCSKEDLESIDSAAIEGSERLMEFTGFNKAAVKTKNFKVREMLIRQLVQIKGVSADKAVAITEFYPTPKLLAEAFKSGDEKLLADIEVGSSKRKIGLVISKTLYQFYTRLNLC